MFESSAHVWSLCDPAGHRTMSDMYWYSWHFVASQMLPAVRAKYPPPFTPQLITNSSPLVMVDVKPHFKNHDNHFRFSDCLGLPHIGQSLCGRILCVMRPNCRAKLKIQDQTLRKEWRRQQMQWHSTPIKILHFIKRVEFHVHEDGDSSVLFPWNRVQCAVSELKEMANGQLRPSYRRNITSFRFTGWGTVPSKELLCLRGSKDNRTDTPATCIKSIDFCG